MTIILIKTDYIISFSIISKIIIKNTFIIIIKSFIIISIIRIIIIIMFIYITFNSKTKNASLIKTSVTISKLKTYFFLPLNLGNSLLSVSRISLTSIGSSTARSLALSILIDLRALFLFS